MHLPRRAFVAAVFANAASSAWAASPGQFDMGGNSMISAMMVFLGNENSVYILDKAEANAAQIKGHPAWAAVWDINSRQTALQDVRSNTFCASGMHLPNGSYVTFGGNDAVTTGGKVGSQLNPGGTGAWDALYQDFDGRKAIRIVNPCTVNDDLNSGNCGWYDEPTVLAMKKARWYSAAEATGNGEVVMIGGFVTGGFVNRWYPNTDPATSGGLAEPTYEYYPSRTADPQVFQFLVKTSGLNAYAHTFLMPSGKFFVQANLSTVLWDHENNVETALPDMPNNVARTYPASGATAMLPLTPANNWTPTMLFCGGSDMPEYNYGDYGKPYADLWNIPASKDCQRITPEPTDGSTVQYQKDDDMLEGRTMGQFIALPDGKMLVINGGLNGTAGYSTGTLTTPNIADMPYGVSLAAGPVLTPVIYDPNAPQGSRWSRAGLGASTIPRLYHSSAMLLPDGSIFVAGSNPNPDVDLNAYYPTEYRIDIFYPPYFSAAIRPVPTGVPKTLTYGGNAFDITVPASSYSGSSNDAAKATQIFIIRGGFTTHAMNMGQRSMQLNNTYTVNKNGTIVLHVAQPPPNSNLFQPGPALLFVTIKGIPSNGTYLILGNGQIGQQPTLPASVLPPSVLAAAASSSDGSTTDNGPAGSDSSSKPSLGLIIGAAAGGVALIAIVGGLIALCLARRKRAARAASLRAPSSDAFAAPGAVWTSGATNSTSQLRNNDAWESSTTNLNALPPSGPYRDESYSMSERGSMNLPPMAPRSGYDDYDPYGGLESNPNSARNSDYYEPPNRSGLGLSHQGSNQSFPGQQRS